MFFKLFEKKNKTNCNAQKFLTNFNIENINADYKGKKTVADFKADSQKFEDYIMKHYRHGHQIGGYLDLDRVKLSKPIVSKGKHPGKFSLACETDAYFKRAYSKKEVDAELLLSRVYNKLGFNSAVYFPAKNGFENYVVSNDVVFDHKIVKKPTSHFNAFINRHHPNNEQFTDNAIEKQIEMRIVDLASFVPDRHENNFYHIFKDKKIDDMALIDYEYSGQIYDTKNEGGLYYSPYSSYQYFRKDVCKELGQKDEINAYVDRNEVAESLGNMADNGIIKTATEIEQNLGYSINKNYVDALRHSYDQMTQILVQ